MAAVTVFDDDGTPHYGIQQTDHSFVVLCGAQVSNDAEFTASGITEHHCAACRAKAEEIAGQ